MVYFEYFGLLRGELWLLRGMFGLLRGMFGLLRVKFGLLRGKFGLLRGKLGLLRVKFGLIRGKSGFLRGKFVLFWGVSAQEDFCELVNVAYYGSVMFVSRCEFSGVGFRFAGCEDSRAV